MIPVERDATLGGRTALLYRCFPKMCHPTCGLEIDLRRLEIGHCFKDGIVAGIKTGRTMKATATGLLKAKRLNPLEIARGHGIKDVKGFHAIIAKAREIEDRRWGIGNSNRPSPRPSPCVAGRGSG